MKIVVGRSPDGEVEFARFRDGGKVHVLRAQLHTVDHTLGNKELSVTGWLLGRQWALCGRKGDMGRQYGIREFADSDLCPSCERIGRGLLPGDGLAMFEHDLPQGERGAEADASTD